MSDSMQQEKEKEGKKNFKLKVTKNLKKLKI